MKTPAEKIFGPLPVALITGAGSGVGRALAILLARQGFSLALVGRTQAMLRATLDSAGAQAPHTALCADLTMPADTDAVVDRCIRALGHPAVLINNAGDSPVASIARTTPEIVRSVFALNAIAPTILISKVWPSFELRARDAAEVGRAPRSVIVNVSSMATVDPFDDLYAYAAAKSSVHSLALSAAKQGARLGVRAFALAPGAIETPLLRRLVPHELLPTAKTLTPDAVARVILRMVMGEQDQDNGKAVLLPSP